AMQSNSEHQISDLKHDLANRKSGVAHFYMKEQDRFFAYAPIIGGNDWFLFTSLPAEAVFERSEKVILLTSLLLTFVLVLLALAALYITITQKKPMPKSSGSPTTIRSQARQTRSALSWMPKRCFIGLGQTNTL
ncbi:MAG: hypothetical protein RR696_12075, partial [Clostridia bacterium]